MASISTDSRPGCRLSSGRGGVARPGLHHLHQDHHHPGAGRDTLLSGGGEQEHDGEDGDEVRGVHHCEAAAVEAPPSTGSGYCSSPPPLTAPPLSYYISW